MRPIRWKSRYLQGNSEIDQRNKRLVGCFNQLLESASKKEHCKEMEEFLTATSLNLEENLQKNQAISEPLDSNFYIQIQQALPLKPYGSAACRKCGLCDIAQANVAEHLQEPINCLTKQLVTIDSSKV